jgi:hypothetical protein
MAVADKASQLAAGPSPALPGNVFAVAEGTKEGQGIRVGAQALVQPDANMGEMTGIPLAIATLMMVRGQVDKPAVHGLEGAVDPTIFFPELAKHAPEQPADGEVTRADGLVTVTLAVEQLRISSVHVREQLAAAGIVRARSSAVLVMWDMQRRASRPITDAERRISRGT